MSTEPIKLDIVPLIVFDSVIDNCRWMARRSYAMDNYVNQSKLSNYECLGSIC